MPLSEAQKQHMLSLTEEIHGLFIRKYMKGAEEHNSNLWELSNEKLLNEAINEAIDQLAYLLTLKQNLRGRNGS